MNTKAELDRYLTGNFGENSYNHQYFKEDETAKWVAAQATQDLELLINMIQAELLFRFEIEFEGVV